LSSFYAHNTRVNGAFAQGKKIQAQSNTFPQEFDATQKK
jgi:hypothetical protein